MDSTSTTAALDADRIKLNVAKQLDNLLAPVIRACRFPVPPPAHLHELTSPNDGTASTASRSPQRARDSSYGFASALRGGTDKTGPVRAHPTTRLSEEERATVANAMAYRACVQQVPGLARLEDRLREGRAAGAECEASLEQLLTSLGSMLEVTKSVQSQSEHLNQNASALLLRKSRLEKIRDELERTIQHFTHIEDLVREAEDPMLTATSSRFPTLAEDLNAEMAFLTRHANFKSAPVYAANVARAQQRIMWTLRTALRTALQAASGATTQSDAYARALRPLQTRRSRSASLKEATITETGALVLSDEAGDGGDDETVRFEAAVASVNAVFMDTLAASEPLRRIAELLIGTTQSAAAEAFGEVVNPRGALTREGFMNDVLNAYRDTRVIVVCPLLRVWVVASCTPAKGSAAEVAKASKLSSPALEMSMQSRSVSLPAVESPFQDASVSKSPASASAVAAPLTSRSASVTGALMSEHFTLPYLAGHLCALMDACLEGERDVLERMWLRDDVTAAVLPKLVGEVTEEVYHAFRSRLLRVDGVAELAETIQCIQAVPYSAGRDRAQVREIADLWQRMIQDTQERLIFRTSIFIRQDIGRAKLTTELVNDYVRRATPPSSSADTMTMAVSTGDAQDDPSAMQLIPAVLSTVTLLKCLYPTVEFSVFSTFAEEAIHLALSHLQELARLVNEQERRTTGRSQPFVGYACQVAHLLYLRVELSRIDAKIVVVEKKLDFAALRRTRLSVIQSSRESKEDVDSELVTASDRLIQQLLAAVSAPLEGAARKSFTEATQAVHQAELVLTQCEYALRAVLAPMTDGTAPAEELLVPIREHLEELISTIQPVHVNTPTNATTAAGHSASPSEPMRPSPESITEQEPAPGSLEEAARTATALAAPAARPLAHQNDDCAPPQAVQPDAL